MARLALRLLALFSTLPPLIVVHGHRPSHELKCLTCLTVLKRDRSTSISLITAMAMVTSMPSMP